MNSADAAYDDALRALARGEGEAAVRSLRQTLAEAPRDVEAAALLADLLRDQDAPREAEAVLVALLRDPPVAPLAAAAKVPELWASLADVRLALGDPAGAARACHRGLKLAPRHAELHWLLGNAFLDADAPSEAAASYQRALESRPFDAETWYNLGVALERLGEVEAAARAFATSERLASPLAAREAPDFGRPVLEDGPVGS
jgi:predicted Zn-dependent protease